MHLPGCSRSPNYLSECVIVAHISLNTKELVLGHASHMRSKSLQLLFDDSRRDLCKGLRCTSHEIFRRLIFKYPVVVLLEDMWCFRC